MSSEMFYIAEKKNTPTILYKPDTFIFSVTGRCFPENARKFFDPIFEWERNHLKGGESKFHLEFELLYINSASILCFIELIGIATQHKDKKEITIKWKYEEDDDEMFKVGEDIQKASGQKFEFIAVEE